jgi:hypothetical protein
MKRVSILAVAIALAPVTLAAPASAQSVADLSVTAVSAPATVSPPGGIAVHRVTITNNGPSAAPANAQVTTTGGAAFVAASSQLPSGCSAPANGTINPVVNCTFSVLFPASSGDRHELKVALRTPSEVGSVGSTSTVAIPPGQITIVDDNQANNSATISTPVVASTSGSAALVQQGESLGFLSHLFSVRSSTNGVIAYLNSVPAGTDPTECGGVPCGAGLLLDFEPDPYYSGSGAIEIQFDSTDPCRGLGAPAACADLYMRKNGATTKLASCALPTSILCIESLTKVGRDFRWTVRVDSNDPEFIPPLPRNTVG